ncbi:MAG: alkaline phosphatase family protein, partial [Gammaproteobacteria bacterium]
FFNGGVEACFEGEDRILVPSPKVKTYDLQPQMSAPELTEKLQAAILENKYDVIICNFANADMVGHSGDMAATIQAIECLDECLGKIYKTMKQVKGEMLITADHGNAERMYDKHSEQAHTAHTSGPVPLLYLGQQSQILARGSLIDIAPTILSLLSIEIPAQMTGQPLLT